MRSTIVAPNSWAAGVLRYEAGRAGAHGRRILPIEALAARLAGGFLQPIRRIDVLDAVNAALREECPPELEPAKELPGLARAAAASLSKVWSAGIDLHTLGKEGEKDGNVRTGTMAALEAAVLKRLKPSMKRPEELARLAIRHVAHAPKVCGDIEIHGRTQMSAVWRPLLEALCQHVKVTWVAGPRDIPDWVKAPIQLRRSERTGLLPNYVSCADGAHEIVEAVRWARDLIAAGKAPPHEIGICAVSPQAYSAEMIAAASDAALDIHSIHGAPVLQSPAGQEAAALADILLNGLSQVRVRRLARHGRGNAFQVLPEGWREVLRSDAPLLGLERWRRFMALRTEWPGGVDFSGDLMKILELMDGGPEVAEAAGETLLGPEARAIWRRALLEGPAAALLSTLPGLAMEDGEEGLGAIAWGPASAFAAAPRPFMWLMGLSAGTWPRSAAEDPLLPDHVIPRDVLEPLPVALADRNDFTTILRSVTGELVISRSRRDGQGRLLGTSPLWPAGEKGTELTRGAISLKPSSHGDRMASRPAEFAGTTAGEAAKQTWIDWHQERITAHDGLIRENHPVILEALARPMSASSIKLMLQNPLGWLFHAMGLREPDVEEEPFSIDARVFGDLVHKIIEAAINLVDSGEVDRGKLEAAIDAAAIDVGAAFELDAPVPPPKLWRQSLGLATSMARHALLSEDLQALPGQRTFAEVAFGENKAAREGLPFDATKPVKIAGIEVVGKIDRLDVSGDGAQARVVDWKTGKHPDEVAVQIGGGAEVQRPIYAAAVKALMPGLKDIQAGLAYLRGDIAWHPLADANASLDLLEKRLLAMREAVRKGYLVPGIGAGGTFDAYAFALPGDAKERWLEEKAPAARALLAAAADVWEDE